MIPSKPPIVIVEEQEFYLFGSTQDAEAYLEAIDVNAGEYVGYDSEGRLLSLQVVGSRVRIGPREAVPSHDEELREALIRILNREGKRIDSNSTLAEALQLGRSHAIGPPQSLWKKLFGERKKR